MVVIRISGDSETGLFARARNAKVDTAYEAEKENLLMYMYGDYYNARTGELDLAKLQEKLDEDKENWTSTYLDSSNNRLEVTGKQSGKVHYIYSDGKTTDPSKPSEPEKQVVPIELDTNKNLGKATLNKTIPKIDNISDYTFKDKFRAYNGSKYINMNIIEAGDTYYIAFAFSEDAGASLTYYVYTFGALNTNMDGATINVTKAGWHEIEEYDDGENWGRAKDEIVTELPVFEGYITTDWDTDEMIPKESNVPSGVATSVKDYVNKLFANILIEAE